MGRTPFDERELTVLVSAALVAAASLYFLRDLRRVPEWRWLLASIGCLVLGSTATLLEHAFAYDAFNIIEHAFYLLQSLTLAAWALRVPKVAA